jgi:hypothetical protein
MGILGSQSSFGRKAFVEQGNRGWFAREFLYEGKD